jgi:hypothetical protein
VPLRYRTIIPNSNPHDDLFSSNQIITKTVYIYKWLKPENNIVRMGMLYLSAGIWDYCY